MCVCGCSLAFETVGGVGRRAGGSREAGAHNEADFQDSFIKTMNTTVLQEEGRDLSTD